MKWVYMKFCSRFLMVTMFTPRKLGYWAVWVYCISYSHTSICGKLIWNVIRKICAWHKCFVIYYNLTLHGISFVMCTPKLQLLQDVFNVWCLRKEYTWIYGVNLPIRIFPDEEATITATCICALMSKLHCVHCIGVKISPFHSRHSYIWQTVWDCDEQLLTKRCQ